MNTYFEKLWRRAFVLLCFIVLVTCTISFQKPLGVTTQTTQITRNFLSGTYHCPGSMNKMCEVYRTIQNNYIRRIPDDELTAMFVKGISGQLRETDPSKPANLKIHFAPFSCSADVQKLCDAYDSAQNQYGKYIPDKQLTEMFIKGFVSVINETDPYTRYMVNEKEDANHFLYSGVGLDMKKEETPPFYMTVRVSKEYNPGYIAGIRRGDQITHVDGIPISGKTARETISLIRGKSGTPVRLTVISGCSEKMKDFTLIRQDTRDVMSGIAKIIDGQYGYVRLAEFDQGTMIRVRTSIQELEKEHGQIKGLVLDLRNDPGGSVLEASKLLGLFIGKGPALYEMKQNGKYISWDIRSNGVDILHGKPIIVLVNKDSASASEITAGAFQDSKRAVIVGTGTYGKGCLQTKFWLKDQTMLNLTEAHTFTPNKNTIDKVGIQPDVIVQEGKNESCTGDEQLATALRILHEKELLK